MKRLLLSLLAVIALPTAVSASEIVVETDLGEKYIVKESSVRTSKFGKKDVLEKIDYSVKNTATKFKECRESQVPMCATIYNIEEMTRIHKEQIRTLNREKENVHYIGILFRPIFIDSKNKEFLLPYDKVGCLNSSIEFETLTLWDYYTNIVWDKGKKLPNKYNAPDWGSNTPYATMRKKICRKYAKF